MKKKSICKLSYAVVLLMALLLVVSCGKKDVKTDPGAEQDTVMTDDTTDDSATSDSVVEMDVDENEDSAMADAEEDAMEKNAAEMSKNEFLEEVVYFDYDSYAIMPSEEDKLQAKAEWMKNNPSAQVTIEGHCDERGTTEYNLALGDRRASKVKGFMENLGVDASRMTIVSYGEEKPVAMGHNEQAWAKNRRAKFVLE